MPLWSRKKGWPEPVVSGREVNAEDDSGKGGCTCVPAVPVKLAKSKVTVRAALPAAGSGAE